MAGTRSAAGGVDLFEDDARRGDPEPSASVFLGNERREPAVLGQGGNELFRIAVRLELSPVLAREARAQLADGSPDLVELGRLSKVHRRRTILTPMSFSSRLRRTSLAVPATNERALAKARTLDADEVFVDLEDAVSADVQSEVREGAAGALAEGDWRAQTLSLRINGVATTWWRGLEVVVRGAAGRLDSVVLPKVESGGDVDAVAGVLAELEAEPD